MYEFDAIGTHWWIEPLDGQRIGHACRDEIEHYTAEFDRRYSRFRDDSLVATLARQGVLVSPPTELLQLLDRTREFHETTDGVFDVLVGNDLERLGYGRVAHDAPGPQKPKLSWDKHRVTVTKGTVIDFGGLGKGWLIDQYARLLRRHGVAQFIVNGGGDLYVSSKQPVKIALEHPHNANKQVGQTLIRQGALAASSVVKRAWKQVQTERHHIIDPATGMPSHSPVVASFVRADTALVADVLATVLLIRPKLEQPLSQAYHAQVILLP